MFQYLWVVLLVTTSLANALNTCTVTLEAETGSGGDTVLRSDASGRLAVELEDGEFISYKVKYDYFENSCSIKLVDVTYSIDGFGSDDYFEILFGSTVLGSFRTIGHSNDHGEFRTQSGFTTEKTLLTSQYVLLIRVLDDGNGAEIDKLSLQLMCTNNLVAEECHPGVISFSPGVDEPSNNNINDNNFNDNNDNNDDNNNDDNTGATIGGVIGGIITFLLACCCVFICLVAIFGSD